MQPDLQTKASFVAISDRSVDPQTDEEASLPTGNGLDEVANQEAIVDPLAQQADDGAEKLKPTTPQLNEQGEPVVAAVGNEKDGKMPDLRGHGARSAAEICAQLGIKPVAKGNGVVVEQNPKAGAAVQSGAVCYLTLGR